jgi:hypothetical protein
MDMGAKIALAGVLLAVLTSVVSVVAIVIGMRKDVSFLRSLYTQSVKDTKDQVERMDKLHQRHFDHAANTGIHQESMSKETLSLHFTTMQATIQGLSQQFTRHTEEDMAIFRDINLNLKEIRNRSEAKRAS